VRDYIKAIECFYQRGEGHTVRLLCVGEAPLPMPSMAPGVSVVEHWQSGRMVARRPSHAELAVLADGACPWTEGGCPLCGHPTMVPASQRRPSTLRTCARCKGNAVLIGPSSVGQRQAA